MTSPPRSRPTPMPVMMLTAVLLTGACARGADEQSVKSRGLEPSESTVADPPVDVAPVDLTASTQSSTSSTTTGPPSTTTSRPRPAPTTSTTVQTATCSPVVTHYPLTADGGAPVAVTVAGDGAVWFADRGSKAIGRLAPDGQVRMYPLTRGRRAGGIGTGPDGSIWFTQWLQPDWGSGISPSPSSSDAAVGHIALDGTIAEFPIPTTEANPMGSSNLGVGPSGIVAGPDGAMWFIETGADRVGRITADGVITEFDLPDRDSMHANPEDITVGPDGAIYVTETLRSRVARIDVKTGTITELPKPGSPNGGFAGITAGADGALWFSETGAGVGRMTTSGELKKFPIPAGNLPRAWPWDLVVGPDKLVWFVEGSSGRVLRVDAEGRISEVATFGGKALDPAGLQQLASADGAVWLAQPGANQLTRITCGP